MAARTDRLPKSQPIKAAKQPAVSLRLRLRFYPTIHPGLLQLMEQHSGADLATVLAQLAELGLSRVGAPPSDAKEQPAGTSPGSPVDAAGAEEEPRQPGPRPESTPMSVVDRFRQLVDPSDLMSALGASELEAGTKLLAPE